MASLRRLVIGWRKAGAVALTAADCPEIGQLTRLALGANAPPDGTLHVVPSAIDYADAGQAGPTKRRLESTSTPVIKRRRIKVTDRTVVPLRDDFLPDDFDALLPRVTASPSTMAVQVVHRGSRSAGRVRQVFYAPDSARVLGTIATTQISVLIELWESGGVSGRRARSYRITMLDNRDFVNLVVDHGYHPALDRVAFDPTRVVLSSFGNQASPHTMWIAPGLHVYFPFRFEATLERYVVQGELTATRVLSDYLVTTRDRYLSTPFTLAFAHVTLARCGLDLEVAGDPRVINEVVLQGEWRWRGLPPFALALWTELTPRGGQLAWQTDVAQLPRPLDDHGNIVADDPARWPAVTLAMLDELLGGWDGWRAGGLIDAWIEPRLAGYALNIDTLTGQETSAVATLYVKQIAVGSNLQQLRLGPCVATVVVLQAWQPGLRMVHVATTLRAQAGDQHYAGTINVDGVLQLEPEQPTTGADIIRFDLRTNSYM